MTKQEQWKLAATAMKILARLEPTKTQNERDTALIWTLDLEHPTAPWEYPWHEVVRSLRARTANRLAKSAK